MLKNIQKSLFTLVAVLCTSISMAQQMTTYQVDSLVNIGVVKFNKGATSPNDEQYKSMKDIFYWISTNPKNPIQIWGWPDAAGSGDKGVKLANERAQGVGDSSAFYGIPKSRVSVKIGTPKVGVEMTPEYGSVVLYEVQRVTRKTPPVPPLSDAVQSDSIAMGYAESMTAKKMPAALPVVAEKTKVVEPSEIPVSNSPVWRLALRTNMLHWMVAVPNVGVEFQPFSFIGVILDLDYSLWSWENGCYKMLNIQPQLRGYFGEQRRFYLGAEAHRGTFNMKFGEVGRQGTHFGAGVVIGYKLRLSDRANIDFNIGGGYVDFDYDKYQYSQGYIVNVTRDRYSDRYYGVTSAGISLDWILFQTNKK